jgi:hypothetical protein
MISGTIINKAEVTSPAKGGDYVHIQLAEYPEYTFTISGISFKALYTQLYVENVKIGDTLYLEITKNDYVKKITKEDKNLTFSDKYVNYKSIQVYTLADKEYQYSTLDDYQLCQDANNHLGVILLSISGVIIIIYGIIQIRKSKKKS